MIRDVKVSDESYKVYLSIDENCFFKNTWKKTGGNFWFEPSTGVWELGKENNSCYLYLMDSEENNILILSQLSSKVGDIGYGQFLSNRFAIAKNVLFRWELTGVRDEWID